MRYLAFALFASIFFPFSAFAGLIENYMPVENITYSRQLDNLDFTVITKGPDTGLKLLVIGGIQGDEPGGFSAASLLSTHYIFQNAQLTIVPNLNFESIISKSRGISGDMNRKFATISQKDPQYHEVTRIQNLIKELEPDIILNLHDGSGFYAPTQISTNRNPSKWGQALIIDQENLACNYGNLQEIAEEITKKSNAKIQNPEHYFLVRNTHTNQGNPEMEKTLTWFAVRNNISAFGLEVSKEFNVPWRTYYHLIQLESFFETFNVQFERSFPLDPESIQRALSSEVYLKLAEGRIILPLQNLKNQQAGYFPLPKPIESASPQPIVALVNNKNTISVHYGNNTLSKFRTQAYSLSSNAPTLFVIIDGEETQIKMGDIIHVQESFKVEHQEGLRINAIGAKKEKAINSILTEANVTITKKDFDPNYSLDKSSNLYRIEAYEGKEFAGMFLVDFSPNNPVYTLTLPSSQLAEPDSLTGR